MPWGAVPARLREVLAAKRGEKGLAVAASDDLLQQGLDSGGGRHGLRVKNGYPIFKIQASAVPWLFIFDPQPYGGSMFFDARKGAFSYGSAAAEHSCRAQVAIVRGRLPQPNLKSLDLWSTPPVSVQKVEQSSLAHTINQSQPQHHGSGNPKTGGSDWCLGGFEPLIVEDKWGLPAPMFF